MSNVPRTFHNIARELSNGQRGAQLLLDIGWQPRLFWLRHPIRAFRAWRFRRSCGY